MAIQATIHGTQIHVGDTVRVNYKIIEKEIVSGKTKREKHEEQKERIQAFMGTVIAIRGHNSGKNFIVRHQGVAGIGVERIFPFISPWIKSVEVKKRGNVRRAKLYYLRAKTGREVSRIAQEGASEQTAQPPKKEGKPTKKDISSTTSSTMQVSAHV